MSAIRIKVLAIILALMSSAVAANGNGGWDLNNERAGSRFADWAATSGVKTFKGDFNGDRLTDFALVREGWPTVPIAFSNGNGGWIVRNNLVGNGWSPDSSTAIIDGDFNNDGRTDIALVRPGWPTMPVAFADGQGGWNITNEPVESGWAGWVATSRVKIHHGDFNGDGRTDIALMRDGWSTIPIAFSDGIGGWAITNERAGNFVGWATFRLTRDALNSGQSLLLRDFNGDGRTDIAVVRPDWLTIPIAFSDGFGGWTITNKSVGNGWTPGRSQVVAGDFNGNGRTDIAVVKAGGQTMPIAFSDGIGGWNIANERVASGWAPDGSTKVRSGDFNGDGRTDIVLARPDWSTMPIAFSNGFGGWNITNERVGDGWAGWVATSGVQVYDGSFDRNGRTDIALIRERSGWATIPVALSRNQTSSPPPDTQSSSNTRVPSRSRTADANQR